MRYSDFAPVIRRISGVVLGALALQGVLLAGSLVLGACGDASETPSGRRVALGTRVTAEALSFTNAYGWQVDVSSALVSIGELRYFEGAPVVARAEPPAQAKDSLARWFTIRAAHAHPGHYEEGGSVGD